MSTWIVYCKDCGKEIYLNPLKDLDLSDDILCTECYRKDMQLNRGKYDD